MPPRSQLFTSARSVTRRPWGPGSPVPLCLRLAPRRCITADEKPLPEADGVTTGPNQEQLPHVSEEARQTSEIMGEATKPEVEEQGTPVQEILQRDGGEAKDKAPKVIQQDIKNSPPKGSRPYSTSAKRRADLQTIPQPAEDVFMNYQQTGDALVNRQSTEPQRRGHIYGLPTLPLPRNLNMKRREDPVVEQVTKLILKCGKLSKAQSVWQSVAPFVDEPAMLTDPSQTMAMMLERLRTASPPQSDPRRPLIPGAPPTSHLPLNPVLYMTLAIDSVAPLFRIRSQKGAAGGGMALQIPVPLTLRQRRRTSIMWILDAASKKKSKGSGRSMFAHKVADELISIVEGKSSLWEKRQGIHKLGVAARANLNFGTRRRR